MNTLKLVIDSHSRIGKKLVLFLMKRILKLIPIFLLLIFILISPKSRYFVGTAFGYWSKFVLSTVNNENKDKWLMRKPKWLNKPQEFELPSY